MPNYVTAELALNNNPQLLNNPGLAADIFNSTNPDATATNLLHATNVNATQQALQENIDKNVNGGFWQNVLGSAPVETAVKGLEWLSKPLNEITRDYRYIHSVYEKHGIFAGTLSTLGIAAGAGLGFISTGFNPIGAVLGADAAAMAERKFIGNTMFKDSVTDSENPDYKISFGRDLANLLGAKGQTDAGWGKTVSGLGDMFFDITMDPLIVAGKAKAAIKGGRFIMDRAPMLKSLPGLSNFLERNSLRTFSADQLNRLLASADSGNVLDILIGSGRQYKRSLTELSTMNAGDIIAKYDDLKGLAVDIEKATAGKTGDEAVQAVHEIFTNVYSSAELASKTAFGGQYVPSRSIPRVVASKLSDKMRQAGWEDNLDSSVYATNNAANFILPKFKQTLTGKEFVAPLVLKPLSKDAWKGFLAQKTRTFSGYMPFVVDSKTLTLSTAKFDPTDPASLTGIYRVFRYSMGEKLARDQVAQYARAQAKGTEQSLAEMKRIYSSGVHEMFKAAGIADDPALLKQLNERVLMLTEGTVGRGTYAHGYNIGDDASVVVREQGSENLAMYSHQVGKWSFPDFRELKYAVRSMNTYGKIYGTVDDFAAKHFTDTFFKPLALLTAGFGIRVAASELLPTIFRFGGLNTLQSKVATVAAKMGYKLLPEEVRGLEDVAHLALQGGTSLSKYLLQVVDESSAGTFRKGAIKALAKTANVDDFELAVRIALTTNGHMNVGATSNAHGTDLDALERQRHLIHLTQMREIRRRGFRETAGSNPFTKNYEVKEGSTFTSYTPSDEHFDVYWLLNVQKASQNSAAKAIAQDVLNNVNNGMGVEEAWNAARASEELRIRGKELVAPANIPAPVVSTVSGVPDLLTTPTRKFEVSEKPTAEEKLAFIQKKIDEGWSKEEAKYGLKEEIAGQRFRLNDEDRKSVETLRQYVETNPLDSGRNNMQAQLEDVYNKLKKIDDKEWATPFQKQAKESATLDVNPIIKLIRKSTINKETTVYRSTSNELIQNAKVGDIVVEPRVMSTSKTSAGAETFRKWTKDSKYVERKTFEKDANGELVFKTVMEPKVKLEKQLVLTIPKDSNALDIKKTFDTYKIKVNRPELFSTEKEILLPPKTKFQVTKVTDTEVYATVVKQPRPNPELVNEITFDAWNKIKEQGGLTLNMVDGSQPIKGFVVGGSTEKAPIIPEEYFYDEYIGPQALEDFIKENIDALATGEKYLGAWNEGGHVYLDISDVLDNADEAERLGKVRDQLSVWNLVQGEEIKTYGTGKKAAQSSFNPEKYQRNVPGGTVGLGQTGMGATRPVKVDLYADERRKLARYEVQHPTEFAAHRVDDVRNTFTGQDGTLHRDLLEQVAAGKKIGIERLNNIDSAARPKAMIGPELQPYVGDNLLNRVVQSGFVKVIDPIIQNISRQPLYFLHVKQEMNSGLKNMVENGILTDEQALRIAMTRAAHAMLPQIHNTALRTQFGVLVRNYLPFYFAQEQAMRRTVKLIADNPNAFRQYQLIEHAINDPGFVQTDDNGNRYMVLPLIGELGGSFIKGAAALGLPVVGGLPLTVTGDMRSLATVLPEIQMPGVSPLVSIAGNTLSKIDPVFSSAVKATIGERAYGTTIIDSLIPSAPARNAFKALSADERDRSYSNAVISAIAAAAYHDQLPGADASPAEKQQFLDRIKNNARSVLVIKAMLSAISPLSPQVTQEDPGLRNEFYKLVKEKGDYPTALQDFLFKHGNNAISYTVARSETVIKGANTPYTTEAFNWLKDNESLVKSPNAVGAMFLVPQTNGEGDVQLVHDELLRMNLREKRTPEAFLNAAYVAAGNNIAFKALDAHKQAIKDAGNNKTLVAAENAVWKQYQADLSNANPIWADDWNSQSKKNIANQAIYDFEEMFTKDLAPRTDQTVLVFKLYQDYKTHQQRLANARLSRQRGAITAENDQWSGYLEGLKKSEPRLVTVINSVFARVE